MHNVELYRDDAHLCVLLNESEELDEGGIHSNQFLILHQEFGVLLDPGGFGVMPDVLDAMLAYCEPEQIRYIVLSHQDPDIVGGLASWLELTRATVLISRLWTRFIPHYGLPNTDRIVALPDTGAQIDLGTSAVLDLIPAHFLHSEGNFQVYDPRAKILFSGDVGASELSGAETQTFIEDLAPHLPRIEGFHRRYMASNRAIKAWRETLGERPVELLAPQHGPVYRGAAVGQFLGWLEGLECGVDLLQPGGVFRR